MLKQHVPRFTLVIFKKGKLRMFSSRKKQFPPKKYVEFFKGSPPGNSTFQATFASPGFAISVDLRSTRAWCGGSYPWKNLNDLWGGCTRCIRIFTWFQLRQQVGLEGLVRVESRSARCETCGGLRHREMGKAVWNGEWA